MKHNSIEKDTHDVRKVCLINTYYKLETVYNNNIIQTTLTADHIKSQKCTLTKPTTRPTVCRPDSRADSSRAMFNQFIYRIDSC